MTHEFKSVYRNGMACSPMLPTHARKGSANMERPDVRKIIMKENSSQASQPSKKSKKRRKRKSTSARRHAKKLNAENEEWTPNTEDDSTEEEETDDLTECLAAITAEEIEGLVADAADLSPSRAERRRAKGTEEPAAAVVVEETVEVEFAPPISAAVADVSSPAKGSTAFHSVPEEMIPTLDRTRGGRVEKDAACSACIIA